MGRIHFIDWMKAYGMLLIVIGHVMGNPHSLFNASTQPAFHKQLGVAYFVFVMGWGLANETRPGLRVAFNRLFPMYFLGILCAALVTGIFFVTRGELQLSNYPPFVLGLNVLLNYFPANPTTWYIGTYLHLIALWYFLLRGREITLPHLAAALVLEIACRTVLMAQGLDFIAYQVLPNWLTLFLLGMHCKRMGDRVRPSRPLPWIAAWAMLALAWSRLGLVVPLDETIPIRKVALESAWAMPLRSTLLSIVYLANTVLVFQIARRLPGAGWVSFLARNTIIIFLAHMPLIHRYAGPFFAWMEFDALQRPALILLLYVGLAGVSEVILRVVPMRRAREWTWARLVRLAPALEKADAPEKTREKAARAV